MSPATGDTPVVLGTPATATDATADAAVLTATAMCQEIAEKQEAS